MIYDNLNNVNFDNVSYGQFRCSQDKRYILPLFLKEDDQISPIFVNLRNIQMMNNLLEYHVIVKTVDCCINHVAKDTLMYYDESILEFLKKNKDVFDNKEIDDNFLEVGQRPSFQSIKKSDKFNLKLQPSKDLTIFNGKKENIDPDNLIKDTRFDCIVQLYGAWFANSKYGIIWKLSQVKIKERHAIQKCMFADDETEDDILEHFPENV